jgi:hypothetical protein
VNTSDALEVAMDVVEKWWISLRKASKFWHIPITFLSNHLNGMTRSKKQGPQVLHPSSLWAHLVALAFLILSSHSSDPERDVTNMCQILLVFFKYIHPFPLHPLQLLAHQMSIFLVVLS